MAWTNLKRKITFIGNRPFLGIQAINFPECVEAARRQREKSANKSTENKGLIQQAKRRILRQAEEPNLTRMQFPEGQHLRTEEWRVVRRNSSTLCLLQRKRSGPGRLLPALLYWYHQKHSPLKFATCLLRFHPETGPRLSSPPAQGYLIVSS